MEDNEEKLLPIGSVVLLKGGIKKVMIIGFTPKILNTESKTLKEDIWDYSGCIYPEGLLSSDQILVFDHSQITEVFHKGYSDLEEKAYKKEIEEFMKKSKGNDENNSKHTTKKKSVNKKKTNKTSTKNSEK